MAERLFVSFEGEMHSVRAGTLMTALGADLKILTAVNAALTGGQANIEIRISAPARGSFEFWIELIGVGIAVPQLFGVNAPSHLVHLLEIYTGLHRLKAFLGGKAAKEMHVEGDYVSVTNHGGDLLIFQDSVVNMFLEDPTFDRCLTDKFAVLEKEKSVDGLRIADAHEQLYVPRSDFPVLSRPTKGIESTEQVLSVRAWVNPVSWHTEGEAAWQVYFEGNKIKLYVHEAEMNGRPFYDVIGGEGTIRFSRGDTMDVQMEIRQVYDPELQTFKTVSYRATHIYEYRMRSLQGSIEFGE